MSALIATLEDRIKDALKDYQATGGTSEMKEKMTDVLNADELRAYTVAGHALIRMAETHDIIRAARDAGNLHAWVSPRLAAMTFEGIFEACFGVWLANGDPADPTKLKPSVERFIHSQVRMFAAALGAH